MKKTLFLVSILLLVIMAISCKAKQKPGGNGGDQDNTGKGPGEVDLGGNFNDIRGGLDKIVSAFPTDKAVWKTTSIATNFSDLSGGYLVTKDKDSEFWIILGITDNQNVQLGIRTILEEGSGQKALDAAATNTNFDPRKLIFNDEGNGGLKLAWSGRAGTSSQDPGTLVSSYTGYDADYAHILHGARKTFGVIGDYGVFGFDPTVKEAERGSIDANTFKSYTYEKGTGTASGGARKAWFWYAGGSDLIKTLGGVEAIKKNSIRFGYGTNDTDYPSMRGIKGTGLTLFNPTTAAVTTNDTRAPDGKMIFFRKRPSQTDITFYTTMVGYNIRMRDTTHQALKDLETAGTIKNVKDVIIEFDEHSFEDAGTDGNNHKTDSPTSGITDKDPLTTGGKNTIKIPFIFFKP